MPDELFIDTNILMYAHDLDAGRKHEKAKKLVADLWRSAPFPWLSVQVLQELVAGMSRKKVPFSEVQETVEDYAHWRVVENTLETLKAAVTEMKRWQLSFWDAHILAAARKAGVSRIWSEDFVDGREYSGIQVVNPLKSSRN